MTKTDKQELLDFMINRKKSVVVQKPKTVRKKPTVAQKPSVCKVCGRHINNHCTDMMCDSCSESTIRKSCGLTSNHKKTRKCLGCGTEFVSENSLNRLCAHCHELNNNAVAGSIDDLMALGWRHGSVGKTKPRRKKT
jgi:hypothetical protein